MERSPFDGSVIGKGGSYGGYFSKFVYPLSTSGDCTPLFDRFGRAWRKLSSNIGVFQTVHCSPATQNVNYSSDHMSAVLRARPDRLHEVFERYASRKDQNGEPLMTKEDFICRYLGYLDEENYNRETVDLLASAADTTKDGFISFEEFSAFEAILCSPDAIYLTAFEMFDTNASESITIDEFEKVIQHSAKVTNIHYDMNNEFIRLYFGRDKKRAISYPEFCQLLHAFHEEQAIEAFTKFDRNQAGYITPMDFKTILTTMMPHMLSAFVRENLVAVAGGSFVSANVSFPWFMAFNKLIAKIEMFKRIYLTAAKGNLNYEMTRDEFLLSSQAFAQITPLEVAIMFQFAELRHPGNATIVFQDIERVDPERLKRVSDIIRLTNVKVADVQDRGVLVQMLESAYRFSLGAVAGACGATAVYPIDLVKTRMQNQRTGSYIGELMYKNSMDCFRKVIRHEGLFGLYRGLLPQLVGVAPEKAIKLTMNDFVRDKFTNGGKIPFWAEMLAGGCGGASQVMFTNPLEIVKIRLQVAGEISHGSKVGVGKVIRELGFLGLYKGARACFLRDIPFSAIFFPVYAHAKMATSDENGHNNAGSLLASAFMAGAPAAFLVTPADVIKTRLQVAAREGQTTYSGVTDCCRKVMQEEGFKALWKGSIARVFRSSPQFGVTLVAYEMLQRVFYVDFGGNRPAGSEIPAHKTLMDERSDNPDHLGGYKLAKATFDTIEAKFGLCFPKFEIMKQQAVAAAKAVSNVTVAPTPSSSPAKA